MEYDKNADPRHREDSEDKVIIICLHCLAVIIRSLILSLLSTKDLIVTLFVVFTAFFVSPTSECLGPILELNVSRK